MCKLCEVLFDSKGRLNQHMLNEHTERLKQLNCNYCSFQSTDRNKFINHTSKHEERDNTVNIQIEQWKCRNCGIIYEISGPSWNIGKKIMRCLFAVMMQKVVVTEDQHNVGISTKMVRFRMR